MEVENEEKKAVRNTSSKHRTYSITINNPESREQNTFEILLKKDFVKDGDYQMERGANGTRHIQGWITFKYPFPFNALKDWFPRAHLEVARNTNALRNYCKKVDTRIEEDPIIDPLESMELYPWQESVMLLITEPLNYRKIIWIYESEGKTGKTWLCRHLVLSQNAAFVHGKANDVLYAIRKIDPKPKLICINLSRSKEQWVSYEAIELLKDGLFFCSKYKSKQVIFNPPVVLVFANFPPDVSCLSIDRWAIYNIIDLELKSVEADTLLYKTIHPFN